MLDLDLPARLRRERLCPILAGLVAHGRDDIPAAALQLGGKPEPQPTRRANH